MLVKKIKLQYTEILNLNSKSLPLSNPQILKISLMSQNFPTQSKQNLKLILKLAATCLIYNHNKIPLKINQMSIFENLCR